VQPTRRKGAPTVEAVAGNAFSTRPTEDRRPSVATRGAQASLWSAPNAGCRPVPFYWHFKNKDDLIAAVHRAQLRGLA